MATKRRQDEHLELLKTALIVQLGLAGVPQQTIRQIVGCDIRRVNGIVKHLKSVRKKESA